MKLFELDGVELEFTDDAIREIARRSCERKTGARGLRAIMESVMMDSMYQIPSDSRVMKCIITKEAVEGKAEPTLILAEGSQSRRGGQKKSARRSSDEIA